MPVARTPNDGVQRRSSGYRQPVFGGPVTETNGAGCDRIRRTRKKLVVAERNIHIAERIVAERNR